MSKLLTLLLLSSALLASNAMAKDYYKDSNYQNNYRNYEPQSYTLSGNHSETYRRSLRESESYPSRQSESVSQGSSGAYRNGNQINNNGLVINRD
jgi:hypothetical protein